MNFEYRKGFLAALITIQNFMSKDYNWKVKINKKFIQECIDKVDLLLKYRDDVLLGYDMETKINHILEPYRNVKDSNG